LVLLGAAFATAGAGIVHLDTVGDHTEHPFIAGFFVVVGLVQLALALAIGQKVPHRFALPAAMVVNAGVLLTWLVSRTVGMDAVPMLNLVPGTTSVEPVGYKDLATVALEVMALMLIGLALAAPAAARVPLLPTAARASLAGLLTVALAFTVPGLAASHDDSTHGHQELAAGQEHSGEGHDDGHGADEHALDAGDGRSHRPRRRARRWRAGRPHRP
jgi:hypothetical protein